MRARTSRTRILLSMTALLACGDAGRAESSAPAPTAPAVLPSGSAASASSGSGALAESPPPLREKLEAGGSCKWDSAGALTSCDALAALEGYVKDNRTPATFDACLAALKDGRAFVRVLASSCVRHFYASGPAPEDQAVVGRTFDAVLDAVGKEPDPGARAALAVALQDQRAWPAGKSDAVLATLEKLDPNRDGRAMSRLLDTLFAFGGPKPPEGALDRAATWSASTEPDLRQSTYRMLLYAPSRAGTSCPLLRQAILEDPIMWLSALTVLTKLGDPCKDEVPRVNDAIVARLEGAADPARKPEAGINSWQPLTGYVYSDLPSKAQREQIAKAAEKLEKAAVASSAEQAFAGRLARQARGTD